MVKSAMFYVYLLMEINVNFWRENLDTADSQISCVLHPKYQFFSVSDLIFLNKKTNYVLTYYFMPLYPFSPFILGSTHHEGKVNGSHKMEL